MEVAKDDIGKRILNEFKCYCDKPWIYIWMHAGVNGNFLFRCPNCGHPHYRRIRNGVMTDERWGQGDEKTAYDSEIHVPKSACQKEKRTFGKVAELRQMEAVGLLK